MPGTIEISIFISFLTLAVGLTIAFVRSNAATNRRIDRLIETVMQLQTKMHEGQETLRQGQETLRQGQEKLRTEMHESNEKLRTEMHEGQETLRNEMHESNEKLRTEMHESNEKLHTKMHEGFKEVQEDLRKIDSRLSRLEGFVHGMWVRLFGEENVRYQLRETEKSSTMSMN